MITFVCFLWNEGYRNYKPEHVNLLAHALQYWHREPHRFVCITDETDGFSDAVEVMPTPDEARQAGDIPAPQGKSFPACYRRLWCFSYGARVLGDRIMLLDVDCMILNPLFSLLIVEGDFVGWRPMSIWGREDRIGGGTWLHTPGTITWLWENFIENPAKMIEETRKLGWNGSDQAIMSRFLRNKYPVWPQMCGIYGSQDGVFEWDLPPKDAIIVHFNSDTKAWHENKLWMRAYCNHFRRSPYELSGQTESQESGRVQHHRSNPGGGLQDLRGNTVAVDVSG